MNFEGVLLEFKTKSVLCPLYRCWHQLEMPGGSAELTNGRGVDLRHAVGGHFL